MEIRADNTTETELQATGVTREVGSMMKLSCLGNTIVAYNQREKHEPTETTCVQEGDSNPVWKPSLKDSECVRKLEPVM